MPERVAAKRAKSEVPLPLTVQEVMRLKSLPAHQAAPAEITARLGTFFVESDKGKKPEIASRISPVESSLLPAKPDGSPVFRIDTEVRNQGFHIQRVLPNVPAKLLRYEHFTVRDLDPRIKPQRPGFLDLHYLPERQKGPTTQRRRMINSKGKVVSTIFPPDRRYIFNDTSYPWCTLGRVTSANGSGTGVMVGPRHLLTVSHIVVWNGDGTAGWLQFASSYFNGSTPFGVANAQLTYFYQKNAPPTLNDTQIAEDYVVCVLDQRLGDITGWMGSRVYTEDWDDVGYWSHVGYSADLGGSQEPSFQNQVSFNDADHPGIFGTGDGLDMEHHASITFGDSGGPFFGWWDGEVGPDVVGVQSAQDPSENWAAGGDPMVRLIQQAQSDNP